MFCKGGTCTAPFLCSKLHETENTPKLKRTGGGIMPARGSKQTLEKKAKPKYEKIDTSALPPLYKCTCCGKTVQDPEGKFFKVVQNSLYKANDGYSNVCTYCCDDYFARMREKYKDEKTALLMTCAEMGWYFSEATYIKMKEKDPQDIRLGDYVKRLNLSQNKDLTFVDYVISSINNEQFLRSKEEVNQQMESEWTKEEQKNKQEVIEVVGYDPFAGYQNADRRYLFNELVKYLDDDVIDDSYKLSQIIQIVNNNNQIRQYDLLIAQLKPLTDSKDIQMLNDLKGKLVVANDKIAKENEISVKNRSNKDIGKSTLTYLMKDLRQKNFDKAEADYYDQLKSEGTRWAMELSVNAIQKNAYFDENDYNEIKDIRRELVDKLQSQVDDLMEDKRKLLLEIQNLKAEKGGNNE